MINNTTTASRQHRSVRGVAAGLAALAILALTPACMSQVAAGETAPTTTTSSAAPVAPPADPTPTGDASTDGSSTDGTSAEDTDPDDELEPWMVEVLDDAVLVADEFWESNWSDFYTGSYTAPSVEGTYDSADGEPDPCGGARGGAPTAFYCVDGDFIAWDTELVKEADEYGAVFLYLIVAHEWGHAIQADLDDTAKWAAEELQADCYAGATFADSFDLTKDDMLAVKASFQRLGDDHAWEQNPDHGTGDERWNAFRDGFNGGVAGCFPND